MIAASKHGTYPLFQTMGLHPVAAFAAVAVDWMLFGGSLATMGIGWAVSIPVGLALGAGVALVQQSERGFNDDWAPAVGKGYLWDFSPRFLRRCLPSRSRVPGWRAQLACFWTGNDDVGNLRS